ARWRWPWIGPASRASSRTSGSRPGRLEVPTAARRRNSVTSWAKAGWRRLPSATRGARRRWTFSWRWAAAGCLARSCRGPR
ncbi:unnamed protein product, partial [Effrenium voratum]